MRYRINVCLSSMCQEVAPRLAKEFERVLEENGMGDVEVALVGSYGMGSLEPMVIVKAYEDENSKLLPESTFAIYVNVDSSKVPRIVNALKRGQVVEELALPLSDPSISLQKRIVMRNAGHIVPDSIEEYMAVGGYQALKKALKMKREQILDEVMKSGLRGRGGAGFPTGLKWKFTMQAEGEPKYLIANLEEGEIGVFANTLLAESDPHAIIEGMIIAGYTIGASEAYLFVNSKYKLAIERLERAIESARREGFLGSNILGSSFSFDIKLFKAASAYVAGEETAIISAIEGKRANPRIRPPYPATSGLWGKPTLINNVETLATVPVIVLRGGEWYASIGTEKSKGTKCISLIGKVNKPIVAEVPFGIKLKDIVYGIGGGLQDNKALKALLVGGPSGGFLKPDAIELSFDYETMAKEGAMVGSGGILVLDERDSVLELTRDLIKFFSEESCGRCIPCRVGLRKAYELLELIVSGKGREEYLQLLDELTDLLMNTTTCALGQGAPIPLKTSLQRFRDEYEERIRSAQALEEVKL